MDQPDNNPPRKSVPAQEAATKKRRWRWWHIYIALVVASFLWQAVPQKQQPLPDNYSQITLQAQSYDSSVGDAPTDLNTAGVQLAYQDAGPRDGRVLLLLHGSPGDSANFDKLIPLLTDEGYRVIAPDLPGFGHSDRWVNDYSNRAHARYVIALMDDLDIERAHLVGFSMGGGVSLHTYDLAPDRVQSITLLAGIGVQEGEFSGDYHFEHLKYGLGIAAFVVAPEFIPHFGFMGDRSFRFASMRNFWDTDQRPNRDILARLDKPLLIIHGEGDPLVPARAAYMHHDLVEHSHLVMYAADDFGSDASSILQHAMVWNDRGAALATDALLPFLEAQYAPSYTPARMTDDRAAEIPVDTLQLPGNLELRRTMGPWTRIGVIILGTFILEDPTSIAVGLFIKAGQIDLFLGAFAVLIGIFLGDLGLYAIGYIFGRRALRWRPIAKWVPTRQVDALGSWFDKKGWKAVLASRFIPGTRLPLYVAAGVTGNKPGRFILWTFLAVSIWVPVILFSVLLLGQAARSPFQALLDRGGWIAFVGVVLLLMFAMNTLLLMLSRQGRRRLAIRLQKLTHHEFWPSWLFYLPLIPYLLWLALRYRSLTVWTLADPCMPDGGVVGESKSDLLSKIDDPAILPHVLIPRDETPARRIALATLTMTQRGWSMPIILKPDAAQRGAGVKLINNNDELREYFEASPEPAQLQVYHAGPFEVGLFYVRMPDEPAGKVFSITDKVFPIITGDGTSSLEDLIWKHPRFRCQHDIFHARFADELQRVLGKGETLRLAEAGNHAQGTLFKDGANLITPQLTDAIDKLCRQVPGGYYFGRIDIRYADPEAFARGEDLAIIELNGVTSESTNIYDPNGSIFKAHRTLRDQWRWCFVIGDAHRKRGLKPLSAYQHLKNAMHFYRTQQVKRVSD